MVEIKLKLKRKKNIVKGARVPKKRTAENILEDSRFAEDVDKRWDTEDERKWKARMRKKLKKKGRLVSRY